MTTGQWTHPSPQCVKFSFRCKSSRLFFLFSDNQERQPLSLFDVYLSHFYTLNETKANSHILSWECEKLSSASLNCSANSDGTSGSINLSLYDKNKHTHIQHAKQKPHTQSNLKNMQKRKQKKLISMYLNSNRLRERDTHTGRKKESESETAPAVSMMMIMMFVRTTTFMKHKTKNSNPCSKEKKKNEKLNRKSIKSR